MDRTHRFNRGLVISHINISPLRVYTRKGVRALTRIPSICMIISKLGIFVVVVVYFRINQINFQISINL